MGRKKRSDETVIHVVFGPGGGRLGNEPSRKGRGSKTSRSEARSSSASRADKSGKPGRSGQRGARGSTKAHRGKVGADKVGAGKDGAGKAEADGAETAAARGDAGVHLGATDGLPQEPLTDLFTQLEIARLLNTTPARLRTLDKKGIASPSGRRRGRRAYTFTDLIALRAAQSLLTKKVRLSDVARAITALKKTIPKVARPLVELRIVSDGQEMVVHSQEGKFEPLSGQMVLDLEIKSLRDDVVRVLRPPAGRDRARTAYELYLQASQLDENPATMDEAEELYAEALRLDPWLAIAYTNLGNIRFRRRDPEGAEALYRKALEVDGTQPEAQYNLGYVMLERGEPDKAIPLFLGAIKADPKFSDAYFNLAMSYEQVGDGESARPHWRSYIQLEPRGTWTEIARRHL